MKTFFHKTSLKILLTSFIFMFPLFSVNLFAQQSARHDKHMMKDSTLVERQHMIHNHSHMVMPFDMSKVTHHFVKTNNGGILKIMVKDSTDSMQIDLIRKHLKMEGTMFEKADFRDPKKLHGKHMPGLDVLSKSKGEFKVAYARLIDGARLTFTSSKPDVIEAIHVWFDAQLKDHGSDARRE